MSGNVSFVPFVVSPGRYGFKIVYQDISPYAINATSSKDGSPQRWDACTYDTALGNLDLCIGNFWDTAERRKLALMSPPLYTSESYMITSYGVPDAATLYRDGREYDHIGGGGITYTVDPFIQ